MLRQDQRILVFDSGTGGLSVVRALREQIPQAHLTYAADTAAFPYGDWNEPLLVERICSAVGNLIAETAPQTVVVACNTASTVALEQLRNRFNVPFVGTVPAIKPAAALTRSGVIGVLATPGTVSREYTKALVETYAFHCEVILHGCEGLAGLAEDKLRGRAVSIEDVRREIASVFVEREAGRTDVVVLGCTHYPLLLEELTKAAPWPCSFVDPADAIARRAADILRQDTASEASKLEQMAIVTGPEGLRSTNAFACFGFTRTKLLVMPVESGI